MVRIIRCSSRRLRRSRAARTFVIERGYQDASASAMRTGWISSATSRHASSLFAPADEPEVTSVRRIELGYSAEDDLGLGDVDLVYKIGNGGERRKRVRSVADSGKKGEAVRSAPVRSLAAKMEWDLSEIDLSPGTSVVHFMEARPGYGQWSQRRSLALVRSARLESARKSRRAPCQPRAASGTSDSALGDRIDWGARSWPAPLPPSAPPAPRREPTLDNWERLQAVHRRAETLLVQLGHVGRGQPSRDWRGQRFRCRRCRRSAIAWAS